MSDLTEILILFTITVGIAVFGILLGYIAPAISTQMIKKDRLGELVDPDPADAYKEKFGKGTLAKQIKDLAEKIQTSNSTKVKTAKQEKAEKDLAHKLYAAGIAMTPATYNFIKNTLTFICLGISLVFVLYSGVDQTTALEVILIATIAPTIVLRYYVSGKVTSRQAQMENQLPDSLDLLATSVGAGMSFDQALNYVTDVMEGPLINEMKVLEREIGLGKNRSQAFKDFGKHCNSDAITNFAAAAIQATEMGIPLHDMLVAQAKAAREAHVAKVKTKAAKASIKMLIPMVTCIFPCIFVVLLGPAVMNILNSGIF